MDEDVQAAAPVEVTGTLHWNDFEGGFWSLEPHPENPQLGQSVVLSGFQPPAGAGEGSRLWMRVVPRPELVDFTMAGLRVDVLEARVEAS